MLSTRHQAEAPLAVLVIEDDTDTRHIYAEYLRSKRLTVFTAVDGRMGLNKIDELRPDVVVLDLMMPRVDGFGVIEYLRRHPPANKPVVLVITAYADQRFKKTACVQARRPLESVTLART